MIQKEFFLNTGQGRKLYAQTWSPASDIKAVVTLIHGFGEHCLRYKPYISYFIDAGIAFFGYDQQGHGQSEGKRGTILSYESLLDDVEAAIQKTRELFPNIPHFIYGHSMGGGVALNYLLRRSPELTGGIITSPWLALTKEPSKVLKNLVAVLQKYLPNVTINSGLDTKYISTVEKEVEKYNADSLNHGRISFRLFYEINRSGLWAIENTGKLKIPILLMHGLADQITSPDASQKASLGNPEYIDFKRWEGKYHELHNESNRPEIAAFVMDWINNKL
jgi:alpha-beta hydrolase superfamily lysophospholipase